MFAKKLSVGLASVSLFLVTAVPTFATADITVSGNGADSNNDVHVYQSCSSAVVQKSVTSVSIGLDVGGNSGKNSLSKNTGGDVSLKTGDVANTVVVGTVGGSNLASGVDCCCDGESTLSSVAVTGNGVDSHNDVKVAKKSSSFKKQSSKTYVGLSASIWGNSGKNYLGKNTGSGAEATTGDVENVVEVVTEGGSSVLE